MGVEELGGDQYQITWETAFANDCQEAFYLYTLDATEGFVPTVNHTALATVVGKEVRETEIEVDNPYLAICAWNNSTTFPLEKYFSKPIFTTFEPHMTEDLTKGFFTSGFLVKASEEANDQIKTGQKIKIRTTGNFYGYLFIETIVICPQK